MKPWFGLVILMLVAGVAQAQAPEPRQRQEQAIEPRLDRPQIVIPRIDTENFELNAYAGVLSIENFGSRAVYGGRAAFHISEDFFLEATYGRSTISDEAFRRIIEPLFASEEETLAYYNVSVAYNFLPGEVFLGRRQAYTSGLFLVGGLGNTRLADEDYFTYNLGLGFRVLPTDWLSVRVDVRDHLFDNDLLGEPKLTHNLELSAGVGVFF